MSMIDASVLLISVFFGLYGLASAVECGIVFKMLARDEASKKMFTPLWEVTNVFLVFGFTALAFLFNGALTRLSTALMATLAFAIITMLVRSCLVLSIFYIKGGQKISGLLLWLFGLATFLVPLTFSAAGVYLLTGQLFWHILLGVVLMIVTAVGLSSVGLLVVNRASTAREQLSAKLAFVGWLWLVGCILPLVVLHTQNNLDKNALFGLVGLAVGGLGLMLVEFVKDRPVKLWYYGALTAIGVPAILGWANRPYLIGGKLKLNDAYGAQSYGSAIVIGLVILLPLILGGFYIFARLLGTNPAKAKDS